MHSIRSTRARLLLVPLLAVLLLGAACGDDDDNGSAAEGTTDTTAARKSSNGESGEVETTNGTGEMTIGGTTYQFTSESCGVGDGDTPLVEVTGKGSTGGKEYEVEIVRSQPADNYVERSKLAFSGVIASVSTKIGPGADAAFEVDGRKVTATGLQFIGAGGAPNGEGSFTVTCDDA